MERLSEKSDLRMFHILRSPFLRTEDEVRGREPWKSFLRTSFTAQNSLHIITEPFICGLSISIVWTATVGAGKAVNCFPSEDCLESKLVAV